MIKVKPKLHVKAATASNHDGLPDGPVSSKVNPIMLKYLAIAPPGWGKTELFAAFPDMILLACEEGHTFVRCPKIIIDCYDYRRKIKEPYKDADGALHMSFVQAANLLENSRRYSFVCIDTVDALVKMISDFFTVAKNIEHISDYGEWGKGYDLGQNSPFRQGVNRIIKSGRGIGLTTHEDIQEHTFKKGVHAKKMTTLPKGILKQVFPQMDVIFHGEVGGKRPGNKFKDRIVVTEGDEDILAKNRGGILPPRFILPFEKRWETLKAFFDDPKTIEKATKEYESLYD